MGKPRHAIRDSKRPDNFRNLFMYAPNGRKDGIQILPVSDVAAKDEFFNYIAPFVCPPSRPRIVLLAFK